MTNLGYLEIGAYLCKVYIFLRYLSANQTKDKTRKAVSIMYMCMVCVGKVFQYYRRHRISQATPSSLDTRIGSVNTIMHERDYF